MFPMTKIFHIFFFVKMNPMSGCDIRAYTEINLCPTLGAPRGGAKSEL